MIDSLSKKYYNIHIYKIKENSLDGRERRKINY